MQTTRINKLFTTVHVAPKICLQYDTLKHGTKKSLRQKLKNIFKQKSYYFLGIRNLLKKTHTFPMCYNYSATETHSITTFCI